ncbi:hypothetical protein M514_13884 [Trichuris suis]|uniref:Uncharacterized protein n=1 Tax=Trichuris suis TaxID=68888 RepID=A0A085N1Y5_9BILA|nr:hypothetical protein M513_13884 [Trichuris suis]KFD63481.1 hypothetical protein M514_13884 [Trichuris suis]
MYSGPNADATRGLFPVTVESSSWKLRCGKGLTSRDVLPPPLYSSVKPRESAVPPFEDPLASCCRPFILRPKKSYLFFRIRCSVGILAPPFYPSVKQKLLYMSFSREFNADQSASDSSRKELASKTACYCLT